MIARNCLLDSIHIGSYLIDAVAGRFASRFFGKDSSNETVFGKREIGEA